MEKSDSDVKKDFGDGGCKDTDVSVGAGLKETVLVCVILIYLFHFWFMFGIWSCLLNYCLFILG